jgi:hypothetical protein
MRDFSHQRDHAIGQDGAQVRLIGDIAGRKDGSGGFSVKIGDLRFRFNHGVAVAAMFRVPPPPVHGGRADDAMVSTTSG